MPDEHHSHAFDSHVTAWLYHLMAGTSLHAEMRRALVQYVLALVHSTARKDSTEALAAAVGASADSFQQLLADAHWSSSQLHHSMLHELQRIAELEWHGQGVLVIRGIGSRKRGLHLPYVGRQILPNTTKPVLGRTTLLSWWSNGTLCYPLHITHVTPPKGSGTHVGVVHSPVALAMHLCTRAARLDVPYHMVVGDLLTDGDTDLAGALDELSTDYVLTAPLHSAAWPAHALSNVPSSSPADTARRLPRNAWQSVKPLHEGENSWSIAELLPPPSSHRDLPWSRLLVLTSDPRRLPRSTTWVVATNLSSRIYDPTIVAPYALHRQAADRWLDHAQTMLGFDAYRGRSRQGLQRHQTLVCLAATLPLVQPHLPISLPQAPPALPADTPPAVPPVPAPVRPRVARSPAQSRNQPHTPIAPLLRDEYAFPARLAESYAASLSANLEIQQILLHWHDQHHLLDYVQGTYSLYALMRSSQLLPVQAIRCLAAKNQEQVIQNIREDIARGEAQVRASGVRIYVNTTAVAVANAPCERNVSGVVEVTQDSDVFEVMGVDRHRLPGVMNWVRSRGTERPPVWEHHPTYRSRIASTAPFRWTLMEWWPGNDWNGVWELVGEARPEGLVGHWPGNTPGTVIDRRWVVSPATLRLAADWILYGGNMHPCWTEGQPRTP